MTPSILQFAGVAAAASALFACSGTSQSGGSSGGSGAAAGAGAGGAAAFGGAGGVGGVGGSGGGPIIDSGSGASGGSDAGACPDGGVPGEPGCDCGKLEFTIDTKQSCAIQIQPGFQVDGEGFISLAGKNHRVFAMDRWGAGHIVAWCDGTTLPQLLSAFDVTGYLGQLDSPKVASFGDDFLCEPGKLGGHGLPTSISYLGKDMPTKYKGAATALAQDYDVIIVCGFRIPWTNDWSVELKDFVELHGKGLLAVMEYESLADANDFQNTSKITSPAGIVFEPLNLAWALGAKSVSIDCVPDLPPPVK